MKDFRKDFKAIIDGLYAQKVCKKLQADDVKKVEKAWKKIVAKNKDVCRTWKKKHYDIINTDWILSKSKKLIPIRFLFFWFIRRMVCISLIWLIKSSYYWNRMLLSQELFLLLMNSAFIGIMMRLFLLFHFIRFRLYQSFIFRSSSRQKIFLTSLIISTG